MFKNLRIRNKLLLSYSFVFILSMSLGCTLIFSIVRNNIEKNIESELKNTTTTILNLVETSATVSIKNYLRAVAEKNHEIISNYYEQFSRGELSKETAQKFAKEILLSQTIGESGYIYCLNSEGTVVVHPQTALLDINVSEYEFVKKQMLQKKGYIEYDWKNPGEIKTRPKALYMLHFEPWDWIISVSSYRKEFKNLVNVDDFRKSVLDIRFGKTGYSFVIDGKGYAVIHPKLQGVNILEAKDLPNEFLEEMLREKTGEMKYLWKNPDESEARLKLSLYNYLPEYDWIVASSSYHEEFYEPLTLISQLILGIFSITLFMVLPLTFALSKSITKPLQTLMHHFEKASTGDFTLRMTTASKDEIGIVSSYFNRFMGQLEEYSDSLKKEIKERKEIEEDLRESEERYRSIMEAAADPIVIYDMEGKVIYFNPAFEHVFGWNLEDCLGKRMDHFVPTENWEETHQMIGIINSGRSLAATETKRFTKNGGFLNVSISGAAYLDRKQNLAGSVIILRDITETKRLTKRLLDIGDKVRQDIGQDLHDDLCPHLIGTAGLAAVLESNLDKKEKKNSNLAHKIVEFIEEAIHKSKTLARGLCPVHLVSHGLQSALREISDRAELTRDISCDFAGDDNLIIPDNLVATHLYYIAHEAVNNAIKHAQTTHIDISLFQENDYIHLKIEDNGQGINTKEMRRGMGMQIMQYRVSVIGAFLEITTAPGKGTLIHVSIERSSLQYPDSLNV